MKFYNELKEGLFKRGSFIQNISVFTTGSFFAHFAGLAFTPFITRIYDPTEYGEFAFFSTILALMISFSTLNYADALILPKGEKKFFNLAKLNIVLTIVASIISIVLIFFIGNKFLSYFNIYGVTVYLYIIPFLVLLNTIKVIADSHNIREKHYIKNVGAMIFSVTSGKSFVILLGYFFGSTVYGLISGEVLIRLIRTVLLLGRSSKIFLISCFKIDSYQSIIVIAKEYINYPKYIFPTTLFLQLSIHLPVFFIGKIYLSESLGYFTLAMSLLGIPIQVIGFSMGKVFLQKANETIQKFSIIELESQLLKVFYGITIISAAGYCIIFGFGEEIFSLIAGKEWRQAGKIACILSIGLTFQLISIVIGPIFRVLGNEKAQFNINMIGSIILILSLIFGIYIKTDLLGFTSILSMALSIRYSSIIVKALKMVSKRAVIHYLLSASIIIFFYAFTFFLSFLFK